MKAVVQRVTEATVTVAGQKVSGIGQGLLVLLGVEKHDGDLEADFMARKIPQLRIFSDKDGKMNLSVADVEGEILVVSQFTLAAKVGRGRRPSFDSAAEPSRARALYDRLVAQMATGEIPVRTGVFGAMMSVHLVNDGPVTFLVSDQR